MEKQFQNDNQGLLIPISISTDLPSMVKNELAKMSPQKQEEFIEEFKRKKKPLGLAYLCWFLFGVHYGFLGKWGVQILYWVTFGGFLIWMFIDLFRIPGMIKDYNKDVATDTMRALKAIS